jgi:putative phosphoribosyl transferase
MFANRLEAAECLAERLAAYRGTHPLILAVPRGGVPMGEVLADRLNGELDVVLVRKLGAPGNPEYAIGAVDETGHHELTPEAQVLSLSPAYIKAEVAAQRDVLRRRRGSYTPVRAPIAAEGRVVIVVDDGVATGATLLAALRSVRRSKPERVIAAVGVAPSDTLARLNVAADEVVCLDAPVDFYAVGEYYADFSEVSDAQVVDILRRHPGERV